MVVISWLLMMVNGGYMWLFMNLIQCFLIMISTASFSNDQVMDTGNGESHSSALSHKLMVPCFNPPRWWISGWHSLHLKQIVKRFRLVVLGDGWCWVMVGDLWLRIGRETIPANMMGCLIPKSSVNGVVSAIAAGGGWCGRDVFAGKLNAAAWHGLQLGNYPVLVWVNANYQWVQNGSMT